jgi:hypothetical protein
MILVTENNKQYYIYGSMLGNTTRTNSLTSYPTIEGTSFSDHYYREPDNVSFQLKASEVSKSLIYSVETDAAGGRVEKQLSAEEVNELLQRWFKDATRVEVTSIRYYFPNMILQSYSWADQDLALFNPTLNFREARVQTLRTGIIENPDQYYQAAYGDVISVGGAAAVDSRQHRLSFDGRCYGRSCRCGYRLCHSRHRNGGRGGHRRCHRVLWFSVRVR